GRNRNFTMHRYRTRQGAGESVAVMGGFRVNGASNMHDNTCARRNHNRWWRRRRLRCWRRCHLLVLSWCHLLTLPSHLPATRLSSLGLAGGFRPRRRILALFFLATCRKTENENCAEHERCDSKTHNFHFPFIAEEMLRSEHIAGYRARA